MSSLFLFLRYSPCPLLLRLLQLRFPTFHFLLVPSSSAAICPNSCYLISPQAGLRVPRLSSPMCANAWTLHGVTLDSFAFDSLLSRPFPVSCYSTCLQPSTACDTACSRLSSPSLFTALRTWRSTSGQAYRFYSYV